MTVTELPAAGLRDQPRKRHQGANMALSGFRVELDALIIAAAGIVAAVQQFKDLDEQIEHGGS